MKKILKSNFAISLFINLIVLICVILFSGFYYELNDDTGMIAKAIGGSEFIVYQNIILGFFYKFLFSIRSDINWYTLFFILLIFISSNIIILTILNAVKQKRISIPISLLTAFTFTYEGYCMLQFTKVAGFVMAAGTMLAYRSADEDGRGRLLKQILSAVLIVLGSMIRFSVLYIAIAGMAMLVLITYKDIFSVKDKFGYFVKKSGIIYVYAVAVCISFGLSAFNRNYTDNHYYDYKQLDFARSEFIDRSPKEYDEIKEQLSSIGISENDYQMAKNWCFSDPDKFTKEVFTDLAGVASSAPQHSFAMLVKSSIGIVKRRIFWAFALVSLSFIIMFRSKKNLVFYLMIIAEVLILYALLIFIEFRIAYRVVFCIWLFAYLLVVMLCDRCVRPSIRHIALYVCIFAVAVNNVLVYYIANRQFKIGHDRYYEYMSGLSDNSIYFMSPVNVLHNEKIQTGAFDIKEYGYTNIVDLGGTGYGHPYTQAVWEKNNITNPYKDIVLLDNAYLIASNEEYEMIFEYIKSNYYQGLKSDIVKETEGTNIYSLYITN